MTPPDDFTGHTPGRGNMARGVTAPSGYLLAIQKVGRITSLIGMRPQWMRVWRLPPPIS